MDQTGAVPAEPTPEVPVAQPLASHSPTTQPLTSQTTHPQPPSGAPRAKAEPGRGSAPPKLAPILCTVGGRRPRTSYHPASPPPRSASQQQQLLQQLQLQPQQLLGHDDKALAQADDGPMQTHEPMPVVPKHITSALDQAAFLTAALNAHRQRLLDRGVVSMQEAASMAFEAPSRNKAGRAGFIYAKIFGAFHPDLYLRDEPCLELPDGKGLVSRSAFERLGDANSARWYRSIYTLQLHPEPHAETLGAWLQQRDMPVLYGACRASTKKQQEGAAQQNGGGSGSSGDEAAGAKVPKKSVGSKRSSKKKGRDSSDEEQGGWRGSRGRKRTAPGMRRSSPGQSNGTTGRDGPGEEGKREVLEGARPRGAWRPGCDDEDTVSPDQGASSGADTLSALSPLGSQVLAAAAAAARGVPYVGPAGAPPPPLRQQPQPLVAQLRTGPPQGVLATGLRPGLTLAMPQPQVLRLGLPDGASPLSTTTGFASGALLGPSGGAPLGVLPAAVVRPLVQHLSIEDHLVAPRDRSSGGSRPYVLSLGEPQHTPTSMSAPGLAARAVLLPPTSSEAGRTLELHGPHPHLGRGPYSRPVLLSAGVKPPCAPAADPTGPMDEGTEMFLDAGPRPGLGPGPVSWSGPVPPGYKLVRVSGPQHAAQLPPGSLLVSKVTPEERPFGHGAPDRPQAARYMAMPSRERDGREGEPVGYMRSAQAVPVPHQHPHADPRVVYRSTAAAAAEEGARGGVSRMPLRHGWGPGGPGQRPEDADGDGGHSDGVAPPQMAARVIVRTLQKPDGSEGEPYGRMTQPYTQVQRSYNEDEAQEYVGPHGQACGEGRVQPRYVVVDRPPWTAQAVRGHTQQPPQNGSGPRLGRLVGPPLPTRHPEQEVFGPEGGDTAPVVQVQGVEGLRLVRMPGGGFSLAVPRSGEEAEDGGQQHGEEPRVQVMQLVQLPGGGFAVAVQPDLDPAQEEVEQQRGPGMAARGHEMEHGDEAGGVEVYRDRQQMAHEVGGGNGRAVGRGPPGAPPASDPGAELHRLLLQRVRGNVARSAQGYEGRSAAGREDGELPQGVARSAGSRTRPGPAGARFGQASSAAGKDQVVEGGLNSSGRRSAAAGDYHRREGGEAGRERYAEEGPAGSDSDMQSARAGVYRGRLPEEGPADGDVRYAPTAARFRQFPGRERYAEEDWDAAPGEGAGVYVGQAAGQGRAGAVGHRVVVPREGVRVVQLPGGQLALEVPEGYIRDGALAMGVGGEGLRLCGPEQVGVVGGRPPQVYGGDEEDGYAGEHPGHAQPLSSMRWQPGGHGAQRHVGGRAVAGPPVHASPGASGAAPRYVYYDASK